MPTCTRYYAGYGCSMCNVKAKAKTAYFYGSDAGSLCVSGYYSYVLLLIGCGISIRIKTD